MGCTPASEPSKKNVLSATISNNKLEKGANPSMPHSNFYRTEPIHKFYDFGEKLGQSSFGIVYKIVHKATKEVRAVKEVSVKLLDKDSIRNEADILKEIVRQFVWLFLKTIKLMI